MENFNIKEIGSVKLCYVLCVLISCKLSAEFSHFSEAQLLLSQKRVSAEKKLAALNILLNLIATSESIPSTRNNRFKFLRVAWVA